MDGHSYPLGYDAYRSDSVLSTTCRINLMIASRACAVIVCIAVIITGCGTVPPSTGSVRTVPMHEKGSVFYVEVSIEGVGTSDFLVDTGAGYTAINENMLSVLKRKKLAAYIGVFNGRLSDGTGLDLPLYRIPSINIGGECVIRDVDVVVLPGTVRGLLGLSVLQKTAPFEFSMDPPTLRLSECG